MFEHKWSYDNTIHARVRNAICSWLSSKGFTNHIRMVVSSEGVSNACGWRTPLIGWYKVNVDGVVWLKDNEAACGGAIRDHNGVFMVGFMWKIGIVPIVHAKLCAIFHGLKLALDRGFCNIMIESNSVEVVDSMSKDWNGSHPFSSYIRKFVHLLEGFLIPHILRRVNLVADLFAKNAFAFRCCKD